MEDEFRELHLELYGEGTSNYIPYAYLKNELYPGTTTNFDGELEDDGIRYIEPSYSDDMDPLDMVLADELRDMIEDKLELLNEREYNVIIMRFGLTEDKSDYTLEEIGKALRLTRERVRQVESSAIKKLKNPKVGRELKNYAFEEHSTPVKTESKVKTYSVGDTIVTPPVIELPPVAGINVNTPDRKLKVLSYNNLYLSTILSKEYGKSGTMTGKVSSIDGVLILNITSMTLLDVTRGTDNARIIISIILLLVSTTYTMYDFANITIDDDIKIYNSETDQLNINLPLVLKMYGIEYTSIAFSRFFNSDGKMPNMIGEHSNMLNQSYFRYMLDNVINGELDDWDEFMSFDNSEYNPMSYLNY